MMTHSCSHTSEFAVAGWDIGGANIKAARLGPDGLQVLQRPLAMWLQRDELPTVLAEMAAQLGPAQRMGITMTAELSDIFRTKREGVAFVLDTVRTALPEAQWLVFGLDGRFHPPERAYNEPLLVAAANWLATAQMVARSVSTCLLVDVGSTTTDTIPIADGRVVARGRSDPERLVWGELLYTGALRTPSVLSCATCPCGADDARWQPSSSPRPRTYTWCWAT
ncbi:MAG: hydantoinase/oxoprolinase family protein [Ardenticatenia bacterium]|nr:hydantoinase/oxoprolinase family protein [Ardenticatenia bacterium]